MTGSFHMIPGILGSRGVLKRPHAGRDETPSFAGSRATLLCSEYYPRVFHIYSFICWGLHMDFVYAAVHMWKLVLSFHRVRPGDQTPLIRLGASAFTC